MHIFSNIIIWLNYICFKRYTSIKFGGEKNKKDKEKKKMKKKQKKNKNQWLRLFKG